MSLPKSAYSQLLEQFDRERAVSMFLCTAMMAASLILGWQIAGWRGMLLAYTTSGWALNALNWSLQRDLKSLWEALWAASRDS